MTRSLNDGRPGGGAEGARKASVAFAPVSPEIAGAAFRQAAPGMQSLDDDEQPEQAAPDAGLDDKLDVVKALARLAPIHREVLVLFYFDDMPTAQMAEALEIAPGTVLSRLARARDALKQVMGVPVRAPGGAQVTPLRKTPS